MYTYNSKENHTGVSIDGTVSGTCSSAMARVGALAGGGWGNGEWVGEGERAGVWHQICEAGIVDTVE